MNYQSTKFLQTSLVLVLAFVGLSNGWLDGAIYCTLTLGSLANYAHHDVKQKGIQND
jgi:hypothetical protein